MLKPLLSRKLWSRLLGASLFTLALGTMALQAAQAAPTVTVGGKNFTEQVLLAEMTTQLLKAKGFTVVKKDGMGSTVLRQAQENGQVDVYWEYTGTSLITYNKVTDKLDPQQTYARVKELDAQKGLVWLDPSKANDTYGIAMNRDVAQKLGVTTMSDLAKVLNSGKELTFACNSEFYARPDGLRPLQRIRLQLRSVADQADGFGSHLSGAEGPSGGHRARFHDRWPRARFQLHRAA